MEQQFDVWVLGPLSQDEKDLAWQVAGAAEAALGSRSPPLVAELLAHVLAGLLFDHCERSDAEATTARVMQHILRRVEAIAAENTKLAAAIVAKQRGEPS